MTCPDDDLRFEPPGWLTPSDSPMAEDRELDELLRRASWPAPDSAQLARLDLAWTELQCPPTRSWVGITCSAAMVTVTAVALAVVWVWSYRDDGRTDTNVARRAAVLDPRATTANAPDKPTATGPDMAGTATNPTANCPRTTLADQLRMKQFKHELLVQRLTREASDRQQLRDARREITEILQCLTSCAEVPPSELLAGRRNNWPRWERILAEPSWWTATETRPFAARLLATLATSDSTPLLRQLAEQSDTHTIATQALSRLVNSRELYQRIRTEPDGPLRQELLAQLWQRQDPASVSLFLRLAASPPTIIAAQEVARSSPHAPLDLLIPRLSAERLAERRIAIQLLSIVPGSEVAHRLVFLAEEFGYSKEMLKVLAHRTDDPVAVAIVRQIMNDDSVASSGTPVGLHSRAIAN